MTKQTTIEQAEATMKVLLNTNNDFIRKGAIQRLLSFGFTKEQIFKLANK